MNTPFSSLQPDFKITTFLGKGSYGIVYSGIHIKSKRKVAIKYYHSLFNDTVDTKRVLREVTILRRMNHKNIIKLIDIRIESKYFFAIFEYFDYNLEQIMSRNLTFQEIVYFSREILYGIEYIHKSNCVHRDIKPDNILVNTDFLVKIADFGSARDVVLKDSPCKVDFIEKIKEVIRIGKEILVNFLELTGLIRLISKAFSDKSTFLYKTCLFGSDLSLFHNNYICNDENCINKVLDLIVFYRKDEVIRFFDMINRNDIYKYITSILENIYFMIYMNNHASQDWHDLNIVISNISSFYKIIENTLLTLYNSQSPESLDYINKNNPLYNQDFPTKLKNLRKRLSFRIGNSHYSPPEIVINHKCTALPSEVQYNTKVDVWSIGVIMLEMIYQYIFIGSKGRLSSCNRKYLGSILLDIDYLYKQRKFLKENIQENENENETSKRMKYSSIVNPSSYYYLSFSYRKKRIFQEIKSENSLSLQGHCKESLCFLIDLIDKMLSLNFQERPSAEECLLLLKQVFPIENKDFPYENYEKIDNFYDSDKVLLDKDSIGRLLSEEYFYFLCNSELRTRE